MPTGYTADIAKGISFNKFVWNCARAFGALVTMRDDPLGAPIPERLEPSPYYASRVTEAENALSRLRSLTPEQAHAECIADHKRQRDSFAKYSEEKAQLRAKYTAMLEQVEAWEAPTSDHAGLKDFMASQLRESIDFDCSTKYDTMPALQTTGNWLAASIARAERDLDYARKSHQEEVQRVESRNAWLQALRASVPLEA